LKPAIGFQNNRFVKNKIMESQKEFEEANFHLVETWSDYVKTSLARGETMDEIRKRLALNNLSEEQIGLILNPASNELFKKSIESKNRKLLSYGIFNLLFGLAFILVSYNIFGFLVVLSSFFLSIMSFAKIRKI
jgi:hypothetical protein